MLVDGSYNNFGAILNKIKSQQTKGSLALNLKHSNVNLLFYVALLSIVFSACGHAKPLQVPLGIPLGMSSDAYKPYDGKISDVEHTYGRMMVKYTPVKGQKRDVSTSM